MSYNTRRGGNFANSVSSVGQRRPPVSNNFVPGGQMTRPAFNQQNKGQPQQQQQQQQPPQQQQQQNKITPQQQQQKQAPPQQMKQGQQQQPKQVVQQQQAKPVQETPVPQQKQNPPQSNMQKSAEQFIAQQQQQQQQQQQPQNVHVKSEGNELQAGGNERMEVENSSAKPKPFWMKRATGRISRAEKMRKRNLRLRRMLQPKNALMVLNELIGSTAYTVQEMKVPGMDDVFKATITIEGLDHVGTGKSKVAAKTASAEAAIKHVVLSKLRTFNQSLTNSQNEEGQGQVQGQDENVEKMDEGLSLEDQEQVSWSHIASFAIHKLFSSWDEDGNITDLLSRSSSPGPLGFEPFIRSGATLPGGQIPEQKPAKKMPENALTMNPIMLLNQMHPNAKYEEIAKSGNPPHIQFTIKCTVLDQEFIGTGRNKKAARKQAAYAACTQILGIQYPPEVLQDGAPPQPMVTA